MRRVNDYVPLVSADTVGQRLGLPLPLTAPVAARIDGAVAAAEGKLLGYLNRDSLVATEVTYRGMEPAYGYGLEDKRAWPQVKDQMNDRYRVKSYTLVGSDGYDVVFTVGLDVAGDPELRAMLTYIVEDAATQLTNDPTFTAVARGIKSVSAAGQSVSFDTAPTGDAAGSGMTLTMFKRFRRLSIYQPVRAPQAPWPYNRSRSW